MDSVPKPDEKDLQKAETFFKYGNEAASKGNIAYAFDMYRNACKIAPMEIRYRQAIRNVARKKFDNDPSKVGRLAGAKLQPLRLRIRTAKARSHWPETLALCEDAFFHNPWDVTLSRDYAEAAEALGAPMLARWSLESVQAQAASEVGFWKHMARVYEACGDFQRAILCWERIRKLSPHDEDATHQIHALSASQTIHGTGLHEQVRREQDTQQANSVAEEAEALRGKPTLSPEQQLTQEIEADPSQPGPYLQLATLYRDRGFLDKARDILSRGLQAKPDGDRLRDAYAEVQMARLKQAIDALKAQGHGAPLDADSQSKLKKLTAKLADYELADLRRRLEAMPDDPRLHFELAGRLAAAGDHDAAIASYQVARGSAVYKVRALIGAGGSFEANGVPKLAERSYADALKAADADDQDQLNDIRYRLGRVAEQLGNLEDAEGHYNEVAANNYGYLDVAKRLRSLNQRMSS